MPSPDQHAERVRSYFDAHAEDWERAYQNVERANDVVLAERLRLAVELTADLEPGSRVLDAGCGTGPLTAELVRRGHRVTAVDISAQMVERCRRHLESAGLAADACRLVRGEISQLDLEPGGFDAVFALGFLQYQDDERAALADLARLLAPGGRLVVSGPIHRRLTSLFGLWDGVRRLRRSLTARRRGEADELAELLAISPHRYSPGRMRRLLAAAELEVLAQRPHGFVNFVLVGPWLGTGGELTAHRLLTRAARRLPIGRFANDLVTLAVKPRPAARGTVQPASGDA